MSRVKKLLRNQRFMALLIYDPLLLRHRQTDAAFIGNFALTMGNQTAEVNFIPRHFGNGTGRPAVGRIRLFGTPQTEVPISQRGKDPPSVQLGRDLRGRNAARKLLKNGAHDGCGGFVDQQVILILRVFPVAVGGKIAHKLAAFHFGLERAPDFFAQIPGVLFVGYVQPWRGAGCILVAAVIAVQHGDIPNAVLGKEHLLIIPGFGIVAAKAGQILGQDGVDASNFNILNHAAERGTIKARPGIAVVNVHVHEQNPFGLGRFFQKHPLILDGFGGSVPRVPVLFGKPQVKTAQIGRAFFALHSARTAESSLSSLS